ncbi:lipid-binding SYLF domain-containing protein [Citrifermentans bremense]|uniref:lipid-binding SYLF domain-containing protein n=1 Tax=Citrifermentans bremense TaxID=60035 RepID=UPI0003FBB476|nr:lipid-binding SYLF domain-containing protein [Citrifermentans bremense]
MRQRKIIFAVLALVMALSATEAFAESGATKIEDCIEVVKAIKAIPEQGVPPMLLKDAQAIAVIPGVIKVGFVIGGRYGTGVLTVRDAKGNWSAPVFIKIAGGSLGWQIGAESTDLVLVFKTKKSVDGLFQGRFTLGADASVAAGPVGRSAEGATDLTLKAEIYSYSRSRGLFAGVALNGAAIMVDDDANVSYYGSKYLGPKSVVTGEGGERTPAVTKLLELM